MKKIAMYMSFSLLALLVAASASAQAWRGLGRLQGVVVDEKGNPVKGAKVILVSIKAGNVGPETMVTDAKGKWVAGGLIGGPWNIDVDAEGYLVRKISANVSELDRLTPPIKIQLEPKPVEQAKPQQKEAIVVGGVEISPETAASLQAANDFMKEQKWKEAAAEYEKALAVLTTNTSLKFALARAYYGAGELKKAIATLQDVYTTDSGNTMAATLLADMLLEDGQLDAGKKVLDALPAGALSDANTIINLGIRFINQSRPEDAYKYFNQAVTVAPDLAAAYYYRGIASLQMKKMADAKADFKKVVEIAPDSSEAKDAKDLLAQMK